MPVTIGIFLNPGTIPSTNPNEKPRQNRSFEYDTLSDQYARFLEKEILPEVAPQAKGFRKTPLRRQPVRPACWARARRSRSALNGWTVKLRTSR